MTFANMNLNEILNHCEDLYFTSKFVILVLKHPAFTKCFIDSKQNMTMIRNSRYDKVFTKNNK